MKEILFNLRIDNWIAALLAFIPALINLAILIFSFSKIRRSFTSSVFVFFVFFLFMWQMEEVMLRLSITVEGARMWTNVFGLGTQFVTAAGLHYTLLFIDREKWSNRYLIIFGLYLPSLFFRICAIAGFSHFDYIDEHNIGWLYVPGNTLSVINSLWITALTFTTLFLLVRNALRQKDSNSFYFKQSRLIAFGAVLPIVVGVGYEVLLPTLVKFNPYPLASSLSVTFSGAIFIALAKYKLLEYSPRFIWTDIAKNTNDGILIVDNDDRIHYCNEAFCRISEFTQSELLGNIAAELFLQGPDSKRKVLEANERRKGLASDKYEVEIRTRSGRYINVEISGFPFINSGGEVIGSVGIHKDITETRTAERLAQRLEQRFQTIIEHSQDIIALADEKFNIIYRSASARRITGVTDEESSQVGYQDSHPDDLGKLKLVAKEIFARPGEPIFTSFRSKHKDGHYIWLEGTTTNMLHNPSVQAIVSNMRDVTEKWMAQEKLVWSEQQYRSLIEQASDGILIANPAGRCIESNASLCAMLGYSREEMLGLSLADIVPLEEQQMQKTQFSELRNGKQTLIERKLQRKDGSIVVTELSANVLENGNVQGIVRDITERKLAESKLIKAETQVRNFAQHIHTLLEDERAGIAREIHDELGQFLVGIKLGLSSFKKQAAGSPASAERIRTMLLDVDSTIQSMKKISTGLRPGILDTLGLPASIEWLVQDFERKAEIKCRYDSSGSAQTFENKFSICFFRICQEALTNIVKHAGASEVSIKFRHDAERCMLSISDNGSGIDPKKLENPFSLGLLGMRERANIIGGELKITSEPGKGTEIQLSAKTI